MVTRFQRRAISVVTLSMASSATWLGIISSWLSHLPITVMVMDMDMITVMDKATTTMHTDMDTGTAMQLATDTPRDTTEKK